MKFPTDLEVATNFHESNQVKGDDGDTEETRFPNGDRKSPGMSNQHWSNGSSDLDLIKFILKH